MEMKYYKLPQAFYNKDSKYFGAMNPTTRELFAILLDRYHLSVKNNFKDNAGRVMVLFKQQELADMMGVSLRSISNAFNVLKKLQLISVERQGKKKTNRIYILETLEEQESTAPKSDTQNMHVHSDTQNMRVHISQTNFNQTENLIKDNNNKQSAETTFDENEIEVLELFEEAKEMPSARKEKQKIKELISKFDLNVIKLAIEKYMTRPEKANCHYLEHVLTDWEMNGATDLMKVHVLLENRKNSNKTKYYSKKQFQANSVYSELAARRQKSNTPAVDPSYYYNWMAECC